MQQRVLGDLSPAQEMIGAKPDQGPECLGCSILAIPGIAFDRDRHPVFRPGSIEERNQAVIEQVEEVAQCGVAVAELSPNGDAIVQRQHRGRAAKAEESNSHRRRPGGFLHDGVDLTCGERQPCRGAETHDTLPRIGLLANRRGAVEPLPVRSPDSSTLEQSNRLEKTIFPGLRGEPADQRRIRCPVRAGHVRTTSVRPRTTAVIRENEFSEV